MTDNKKSFLISGATGLIGKALIRHLLDRYTDVQIYAIVRNEVAAKKIFGDDSRIIFLIGDVRNVNLNDCRVSYVIHCAGMTASSAFVNEPVETIDLTIESAKYLLNYAKMNKVERFIYLSTMEVYGVHMDDEKIYESDALLMTPSSVRACYPISKALCENMCIAYQSEYDVPLNIIRLTQTFGPGVRYDDRRVFAEFARCVIEKKDIVLNTAGLTKRSYLHIDDAAEAVISILENGKPGEIYNAANPETYCTIREMADMVAGELSNGEISVKFNENHTQHNEYAPELHMNLSVDKLKDTGWNPKYGLSEMYKDMINEMKKEKQL